VERARSPPRWLPSHCSQCHCCKCYPATGSAVDAVIVGMKSDSARVFLEVARRASACRAGMPHICQAAGTPLKPRGWPGAFGASPSLYSSCVVRSLKLEITYT
jgi:hypothetical protein